MSSREEFAALLRADPESGFQPQQSTSILISPPQSKSSKRPPQSPRGEHTPLLPPISPRVAGKPPVYDVVPPLSSTAPLATRKHIRSSSDFAGSNNNNAPHADPSHPLKIGGGLPPPHSNRRPAAGNKPPLRAITTTPGTSGALGMPMPPPPKGISGSGSRHHRRSKSDMPKSVSFGASLITKSDLLKNFPDPRWSGSKLSHVRKRSGSADSNVFLLDSSSHGRSSSGVLGYGSMGSERGAAAASGGNFHVRTKSDMSFSSAVTDLTKSALVREVTEGGRIRFQLPKDNFRILMDCTLETGNVYSRKLLDNEEECFIEFHTEELDQPLDCPCHCTCDRCHRCSFKQKVLPPTLFVMAVDSTLYRRMMDEIVESKQMPCGLFFCGHHEDVRSPDIRIAVGIVSMVFVCLILATEAFGGD